MVYVTVWRLHCLARHAIVIVTPSSPVMCAHARMCVCVCVCVRERERERESLRERERERERERIRIVVTVMWIIKITSC